MIGQIGKPNVAVPQFVKSLDLGPLYFVKMTEDPKELGFIWIIPINSYCVRN